MKNEKYERPIIVQLMHGHTAKHGTSVNKHVEYMESIDENKIENLIEEYGSPLFVFSEKKIRELYHKAYSAFSSNYPKVQFSWSYKTNYLRSICSIFHSMGSIAEVVSEFEYQKARNLGIPGSEIIYNGPDKPADSIEIAINEGASIHIDNFEELIKINQIAKNIKKTAKVGVRVNLNTGTYPQWSRFGLNYETGQVHLAIKKIMELEKLELVGIHTHIGTFMLEPQSYEVAASKMCDLYNYIKDTFNQKLDYIDLGGGFPSKSHLKGVYQGPEISVKNVELYADAITKTIKSKIRSDDLPTLILETGRHLIDEAGYLLTKVITSKIMPDSKRSYVIDAGVNLLYTSTWYNFKISSDSKIEGLAEPAIINGPLCMNIDIIESNLSLPYIKSDTNLVLYPVGAYNITQSMQFIKYRPAVVLIDEKNKTHLIKKREKLETVEYDEVLPKYLNRKNG